MSQVQPLGVCWEGWNSHVPSKGLHQKEDLLASWQRHVHSQQLVSLLWTQMCQFLHLLVSFGVVLVQKSVLMAQIQGGRMGSEERARQKERPSLHHHHPRLLPADLHKQKLLCSIVFLGTQQVECNLPPPSISPAKNLRFGFLIQDARHGDAIKILHLRQGRG